MKPIEVLIVMSNLDIGGAQKSLISLLTELDYEEIKIDLLLFKTDGIFVEDIPGTVNVIELDDTSKYYFKSNKVLLKDCIRKGEIWQGVKLSLNAILNKLNIPMKHDSQRMWKNRKKYIKSLSKTYDVAIGYLQSNPVYYIVDKVSAKKKIAYFHSDYIAGNYNKNIDKYYYDKVNKIVTVSNESSEILKKVFPEYAKKILVIENLLSIKHLKNMANLFPGFQEEERNIKLLTVGRIAPVKQLELQIEIANKLNKNDINFKWYVIGTGEREYIHTLQKQISNYGLERKFVLLGPTNNPYPFFKGTDLYVQTSLYESFCISVAEAKVFNKVVVSTNFTGIKEQITHEKTGFISNDKETLTKIIETLILNNDLRKTIEANLKKDKIQTNVTESLKKFYNLLKE